MLIYGDRRLEKSGYEPETTNNRMELTAAIEGLRALKEPCEADINTDSAYLCNAFSQGWVAKWLRNGWLTASKKPVENQDLWKELLVLGDRHKVVYRKVRGHSDNALNNRCDELATGEIKKHAGQNAYEQRKL